MSTEPRIRHTGTRALLLVVIAVLVAAAVAAVPAAAAPTPTTLAVTPQSTLVNWNATGILNGVLQTAENPPRPVDQQLVEVQFATTSLGPWTTAATVTNSSAPYTSGAYTYSWVASRNYYWRMNFAGTAEWGAKVGNVVYVKVKPRLGKPRCPASAGPNQAFRVYGSLKPQFDAGTKTVKVRAQRYTSGKWKAYRTWLATNADSGAYSKYSVRIKLPAKGKYRFYATSAGTSAFAAARSTFSRQLKVK
jgi:hypothetical protein